MGVPKRLTEMQKRFAEYLVFGGPEGPVNKSEAAKLAGYSEKRCMVEGSELTNPRHSPLVVKYLDELKIERMLKYGVTYESHITELARIKNNAENKPYDFGQFINKYPGLIKNSIIFCAEWAQADLICDELIQHTKSFIRFNEQPTKEDQAKALNSLGLDLDCIITCHALSEGIDIQTLENIFLIASYGTQLETIQRIGRCIRIDPNNKFKIANVIDLIVYRNLDSGDIIEADKKRMNWIKEISEVKSNG